MTGNLRLLLDGLRSSVPPITAGISLVWVTVGMVTVVYLLQLLMVYAYSVQRSEVGIGVRYTVPDQVAAIIESADNLSGTDRKTLLRAVNGVGLHVEIMDDFPRPEEDGSTRGIPQVIQRMADYLPPEKIHLINSMRIWLYYAPNQPAVLDEARMALRLSDGKVLYFLVSDNLTERFAMVWNVMAAGVIGLIIMVVMLVAVRRVVAPLKHIARAAERLGQDLAAPPLEERGVGELRTVANAFNTMQHRIRSLVDQRTHLLAGISHDLRTTLARLQLRLDDLQPSPTRDKALREADYMLRVFDQHMDFARSSDLREPKTRFDIAHLIQDIADDAREAGSEAGYSGPDRMTIQGRPDALRRALTNLANNAITYGERADLELAQGMEGTVIRIMDRGPGISPENRTVIFEPFQRLSRETPPAGAPRVGLGLAIARAIIQGHGGTITVGDREDGGAVFEVTLPDLS